MKKMIKTSKQEWSRRKFITTLTGAGTVILINPLLSWTVDNIDPRVAAIVAKTAGIDTHNHIDVPLNAGALPVPKLDLAAEIKKSGLSAICMTFALDYQKLTKEGEAFEKFINGLDAINEVLKSNNMKRSLNLIDIQAAHKNHQPTVIQSVEGCHFLEGKIERLQIAYNKGLRHIGLLHDSDASVPLGDVYTNPPQWGGLTTFGTEVIKQCNKLGILVDLTHCSNETIKAALKVTTQPVIISHTGLDTKLGQNEFMAKMMRPRLISKEQARIVADAGGVIGVWTHLSDTPLEYAQNIRAMADVIGVDHVCIGTDTKMTMPYHSSNDFGERPAVPPAGVNNDNKQDSSKQDRKPPNFQNKGKRSGERTNDAWQNQKTGFYYSVVDALLKTGFNEDEICKIGGGNFCRIFNAATTGH